MDKAQLVCSLQVQHDDGKLKPASHPSFKIKSSRFQEAALTYHQKPMLGNPLQARDELVCITAEKCRPMFISFFFSFSSEK
uniref:Uncharacterized protein n=1 Tax=Nelumbo nucifera TaxID=4432 RepID=A0A822YC07_NELNU|nr:TPA_asm: hypothetical protein HUJ06_030074 [Nelumbo nucifera]